ncbi:glycosyltransferase [Wenyingzhuangia sp. 2_MG-2023]|nr:glycosyltransferase [Wenyingzhuangia sp. 2_MG-2023]MDO6738192.1 glycosyltransferase [Wenyingzhuangia sp. 2_MG-2023]MDO6801484.1 glycosyltransferase [Wenyingzhuangia sp. 1_MG-2023]
MKLAIVTSYPPSKVTLNEYAYHLVKHFRQKEQITEIVLLTDKTPEAKDITFEEQGCTITVKECWEFNSYKNILSVSKAVSQTKPDVVMFNLQFMKFGDKKLAAALGLMLPLLLKLKKVPTLVLLHNILEEVDLGTAGFTSNKMMQKLYGFIGTTLTKLILQADTVIVTMEKYVKILEAKYKKDNIVVIPHGTFEIPETPNFETPEGPLQIMTFGKFGTYKKVEMMIEAVELIKNRTKLDLEVVIAGTDNPNVPGYLKGVEEKYKNLSNIRFTGYVEENQVEKLFQESAMVVFPYTSTTGSSGVLHQAGSYGKAVVMPDLGDLALLVQEEGYEGEFFDPTSVESLADAIQKIAEDESYRKRLGKTNYKAATAFPMSMITELYLMNFEAILPVSREMHMCTPNMQ